MCDENYPSGFPVTSLCNYVLANYSAAGTVSPAVGDYVTYENTGNFRVALLPDGSANVPIGRVKSVNTSDLTVVVEWLNVIGSCKLPIDDLSTATLLNSAIKDGDTTVVANFDAGATTGPMVVIGKSGTAGAGYLACAVTIKDA